jgi:hypothetical protein
MRFAPNVPIKATAAVAVVMLLAVGSGAYGGWRLLGAARNHYAAASTAADLKFDLSELSGLSDEYVLTPASSAAPQGAQLSAEAALDRVNC